MRTPFRGVSAIALLAWVALIPAHSQIYNQNLVKNPGAESSTGAQNFRDAQAAPIDWTVTGGLSVGIYGNSDFLSNGDFGPVNRGKQFFYGGPGDKKSTAVQTVDLSAAATDIDAGKVRFDFSGWLGMIAGSYDTINQISLKAEFLDAASNVLLTATGPGPLQSDINFPSGLLFRQAAGFLPPNVRKARITIDLNVGSSGANGYAADNISLVLSNAPMFGVNLLANGDAETDPQIPGAAPDAYLKPVPGWSTDSDISIARYGEYKEPAKTDHIPTDAGKFFFNCATSRLQCRAFQSVDFSSASKLVDGGRVSYSVSAWLGGYSAYPDTADVVLMFYDGTNKVVGSGVYTGPVTQDNRNGLMGLWPKQSSGIVPTGARRAEITLRFHKLGPVTDNLTAYADSITFQLDSIYITHVYNAAGFTEGAVAPGEFVAIMGQSLGTAPYALAAGSVKDFSGTSVTFNGIEAFLTYTSPTQVNAIVPYGVGPKADVVVSYSGRTSDAFPVATTDSAPGIFAQAFPGQIWAVNNDYTYNAATAGPCAFNPAVNCGPVARNGGWISLWATGQGLVNPAGVDGEPITTPKNINLPVKVTIGGIDANLIGSAVLTYTGEIQVNVWVPSAAPAGNVPITLTIGNAKSRGDATIAIK
jgi:uncharacterized protein (TIGR03437 family)